MTQGFSTPKEGFRQLTLIHIALCSGLIFMFVTFWLLLSVEDASNETDDMIGYIIPLLVLGAVWVSMMFNNIRKKQGRTLDSFEAKLNSYRITCIARWAIIEGATLIAVVFYFFVYPNQLLLVGFAIGLAALALFRPKIDEFANDYGLTNQEISALQ